MARSASTKCRTCAAAGLLIASASANADAIHQSRGHNRAGDQGDHGPDTRAPARSRCADARPSLIEIAHAPRLVDGLGLGMHLQLAVDAFHEAGHGVTRHRQQRRDLLVAVALGTQQQHLALTR